MSNYNSELQSNNVDLQAILNTINGLPSSEDMQKTPTITVNSSTGLITATAGTKSSTYQLAFQAAQTITPTTTNQTIAANTYLGGVQTIKGDANLVASNIVSGKSIFGVVGTADPFANLVPFTYTVNAVSGASYGFAKNSDGYYESQNKGKPNTYAICRVNFNVKNTCDIVFDVINYAEGNFDYAIFGNLNSALTLSNSDDSSVKKSFKGLQSASIVNVIYSGVTAGNHYIDIKFIKDTYQNANNDSVQFKVQEPEGGLSQETINKILAADEDLVASNIKSGVDIFGVTGTYEGSGGDMSMEDGFVDRTLTSYTNGKVTTIGSYAFMYCNSLSTISFPKVTTIGTSAFGSCNNLSAISFPVATSIGAYAFGNCYNLSTANFPEVTTIGISAFAYCSSLSTISFPKTTSIGQGAFYCCSELAAASFPEATTISSYAFYMCNSLSTISFPKVTTIGTSAFVNCIKLSIASFPEVTTIDSGAFSYCYNLSTASFPEATTIGANAFRSCYSLSTISFPKVTTIGISAFGYCSKLATASFPEATAIGSSAFMRCSSLAKLYLGASSICTLGNSNAFSVTSIWSNKGAIYVPSSLLASYKTATNWAYFSNRIFGI